MTSPLSVLRTVTKRVGRAAGLEVNSLSTSFTGLQRRLLNEVDLLVDVGANTGQYAALVRSLGYRGQIVSFEPGRQAFDLLADRAAADARWDVRQCALGAAAGTAVLHLSANSASSSMLPIRPDHIAAAPYSHVTGHEKIRVSTADEELAGVPGSSLWLKMDVQGGEMDVLRGADATCDRVRVVQSEMLLGDLYEGQADYLEVCAVLRDRGLRLHHVERGFQDKRSGLVLAVDGLFVRTPTA